jgi:hypothetical protein
LLRDDQQRRRFEREARAAAKLHYTNIVPVLGVAAGQRIVNGDLVGVTTGEWLTRWLVAPRDTAN